MHERPDPQGSAPQVDAAVAQTGSVTAAPPLRGRRPAPGLAGAAAALRLQRSAGNRAISALAGAPRATGRSASRALIQRDALAEKQIIDELAKPGTPGTDSGTGAGTGAGPDSGAMRSTDAAYESAYRILNGLAMSDMLSTLTALQRSGQFATLQASIGRAKGVFTERLQLAFDAVSMKSRVEADAFMLSHSDAMKLLPQDQRENIITYLQPDWFDELKFAEDGDAAVAAIRATPAYSALAAEPKALADEIIDISRKRTPPDQVTYYLSKLKQLFDTPEQSAAEITAETTKDTGAAVISEKKRVAAPAAAKNAGLEEKASHSRKRVWTAKEGKFAGGWYYVDASDTNAIVVKVSVFLQPAGSGTAKDVAAVKSMEDGIEKAASMAGYTVDLTFVDSAAADALGHPPFSVGVDPGAWEVADNWAGGGPRGYAHELHHLMAFELDRYDYIESHATNEQMAVPKRLYWFRQELDKPPDYNDPTSLMASAPHPNDDDVCRVAGLDPAVYVPLRQKARAAKAKGKGKAAKP